MRRNFHKEMKIQRNRPEYFYSGFEDQGGMEVSVVKWGKPSKVYLLGLSSEVRMLLPSGNKEGASHKRIL